MMNSIASSVGENTLFSVKKIQEALLKKSPVL